MIAACINQLAFVTVASVHFAFVLFVALGALLVLRWHRVAWLHIPAVLWAGIVEIAGWICPLTPLEIEYRTMAGASAYSGDFVGNYIFPLLYPSGLTREIQLALGTAALVGNGLLYWFIATRFRRRQDRGQRAP